MSMTPLQRVEKLAEYFTGPAVVFHSIGLSMGGDRAVGANAFYEARNAFDITGYMGKEDAKWAIAAGLGVEL